MSSLPSGPAGTRWQPSPRTTPTMPGYLPTLGGARRWERTGQLDHLMTSGAAVDEWCPQVGAFWILVP